MRLLILAPEMRFATRPMVSPKKGVLYCLYCSAVLKPCTMFWPFTANSWMMAPKGRKEKLDSVLAMLGLCWTAVWMDGMRRDAESGRGDAVSQRSSRIFQAGWVASAAAAKQVCRAQRAAWRAEDDRCCLQWRGVCGARHLVRGWRRLAADRFALQRVGCDSTLRRATFICPHLGPSPEPVVRCCCEGIFFSLFARRTRSRTSFPTTGVCEGLITRRPAKKTMNTGLDPAEADLRMAGPALSKRPDGKRTTDGRATPSARYDANLNSTAMNQQTVETRPDRDR